MIIAPPPLIAPKRTLFKYLGAYTDSSGGTGNKTINLDLSETKEGDMLACALAARGGNYNNFPQVTLDGNRPIQSHAGMPYGWVQQSNTHYMGLHEFDITASMAGNASVPYVIDPGITQAGAVLGIYLLRGYHRPARFFHWVIDQDEIIADDLLKGNALIAMTNTNGAVPLFDWTAGVDQEDYELDSGSTTAASGASLARALARGDHSITKTGASSITSMVCADFVPLTGRNPRLFALDAADGAQGESAFKDLSWRSSTPSFDGTPTIDFSGSKHGVSGNGAFDFDGASRIQFPARAHPGNHTGPGGDGWCIEFWENADAAGGSRYGTNEASILIGHTTPVLYLSSTGGSWDIANARSLGTYQNGVWVHRAVSFDPSTSTWRIFEDGVLIDSWVNSSEVHFTGTMTNYMAWSNSSGYFNGRLEDMAIWTYPRYTAAFTPPGRIDPYAS